MVSTKKSPAVFAGLIGISAFVVPVPSYAVTVAFTFEDFAASPAVYFALGCLAGGCIAGIIVYLVQKHAQRKLRNRLTNELNEARAALYHDSEQEMAGSLMAPNAGVFPEEASKPNYGAAATDYSDDTFAQQATARHPQVHTLPTPIELGYPSPFVSRELDERLPHVLDASMVSTTGAVVSGSNMAAVAATPEAGSSEPEQSVATEKGAVATPTEEAPADETKASVSTSGEDNASATGSDTTSVEQQGTSTSRTSDLGSTYAERQENRKKGVFNLLSERLGPDMMADVPVIERPDGSVADIGTSWWSESMGNTVTKLTTQSDAEALGLRPANETTDLEVVATLSENQMRRERARALADRLPNFDAPLYPETHEAASGSADDAQNEEEDLFEEAMRNMDDELPNMGITTSSDAMPTGVIPPEALANFQTTPVGQVASDGASEKAHVEKLMREEIERNRMSTPERRRRSWHVVDGGVASTPGSSTDDTSAVKRGPYRPKHMARKQA